MATAELFPIHQECQEEEKEATAAKKACSFALGESLKKVCLNGKQMTKNGTSNQFYFEAFRRDLYNHAQILGEVCKSCLLPSMAKPGPDQLLSFKRMLQEHSQGTLGS